MDPQKLTTKSQEALADSARRAAAEGHPHIEPVHLLLALLAQSDSTVGPLLDAVGAGADAVRRKAEGILDRLPSASGPTVSAPGLSRQAMAVLTDAGERARSLGDDY